MSAIISPSVTASFHRLATDLKWSVLVYVGLFLITSVHEFGHYLTGSILGFKCKEFRVGNVCWLASGGWKLQLRLQWLVTARVIMYPDKPLKRLRVRFIAMVLGGPCANIGTAFVVAFLSRFGPRLGLFAMFYFIASLLFGIANLLPIGGGRHQTDGQQTLDLLFSEKRKAKMRSLNAYLEAVVQIRDCMSTSQWSSAKLIAEETLIRNKGRLDNREMEKALQDAIAICERGITGTGGNGILSNAEASKS